MAIIRWHERPTIFRPSQEMERLRNEMNQLFADFFPGRMGISRVGVFPALNMTEDANNIYIRAELPGIKPEAMDISVEGETLTLRGERKLGEPEGVSYHRRERESGRFRRIVTLPSRINPDSVEASFKDGVLKIVLPKAEEARPKQIEVKVVG